MTSRSDQLFVGIDPGRGGAICILAAGDVQVSRLDPGGRWIDQHGPELSDASMVLIETQQWRGGDAERSPASIVKLAESYGIAQGAARALCAPGVLSGIDARAWRKVLGLPACSAYARRKATALAFARTIAPDCPAWAGDAVCLAETARRIAVQQGTA